MTIRLRYHLALLPLFLGLTVANVGWYLIVESREIAWGLAEAAEGRALALAAFAHPQDTAGRTPISGLPRFIQASGEIAVWWFEPDPDQWSGTALAPSAALDPVAAPTAALVAELRRRPAVAQHLRRPAEAHDQEIAYAGVRDSAGDLRAIVAVAEPDRITRAEWRRLLRESALFAGAVMLAGLAVAEILARRARRDLASVLAGARSLARGEYNHAWPGSTIRELDDLSVTLRSIDRILWDGVHRTRRRFLRAQQLPGDAEIAAAYQQRCATLDDPSLAGADRCVVRRVGRGCPNDFWGVRTSPGGWRAAVGRLQTGAETMPLLERIVRANAARDLVLGQLDRLAPAEAWIELDAVLPAVRGESISWRSAGDECGLQAHGVDRSTLPAPVERVGVLGTLDVESMLFARAYVKQFPQRPLDAIADELAAVCAERDAGLLLIFRLPPPSDECPVSVERAP